VLGGQHPGRDQDRLAGSGHADPARAGGHRQPNVVERRPVEVMVDVEMDVEMDVEQRRHEQREVRCNYAQVSRSTTAIVAHQAVPSAATSGRRDSAAGSMIVHVANARDRAVTEDCSMPISVIVSYDGTANDDDAIALGQMLQAGGAALSLAYVRHTREYDPRREELAQHDAERRLEQGAVWLDNLDVPRHVVVDRSTGSGLGKLAAAEQAALIVFGSDYRTPPGRVEPGSSAQQLLEGGSVAVAVAAAGLRTAGHASIRTISVALSENDDAPQETAAALAAAVGASISAAEDPGADLIVVGSAASGAPGQIALSGAARSKLDSARSSVLVLPRATPILF
jgi:nucleotide-binding universal stress UspA family protein